MKILHIITNFSDIGGAEMMLIRAINASSGEHQHAIISLMNKSEVLINKLPLNVTVIALNSKNPIGLLLSAFKVKNFLKNQEINIIYAWMYHANLVGALTKLIVTNRIKLIWGVRHSLDDFSGESISTKLAIFFGKIFRWVPDFVIFCSRKSLDQHIKYKYCSAKKAIYIPNGYTFQNMPRKLFQSQELTIGTAGRLHDAKDYKTFFALIGQLLKRNGNLRIRVAGRGLEVSNIEIAKYLKENDISKKKIELLGQIDTMDSFYENLDFFVLTSKTEAFPNVLAEAMAAGCICFTTDVGDASLILDDHSRVVNVGDTEKLVLVVEQHLNLDSDVLKQISRSDALKVRAKYNIDKITKDILNVGAA